MRRTIISILSFVLALLMLVPMLAACTFGEGPDAPDESTQNPSGDESESSDKGDDGKDEDNKDNAALKDAMFGPSIEYVNSIVNGVQSYYTEAERSNYRVDNLNTSLEYSLDDTKLLSYIANKNGGVYIADTMDVYVQMEGGDKIYASSSEKNIRPNIYRIGYYYYDVHFLENSFKGNVSVENSAELDAALLSNKSNGIGGMKTSRDGEITLQISGGDPYIYMPGGDNAFTFSADDYNAIQFTISATNTDSVKVYYVAGSKTTHNDDQCVEINIVSDGNFNTYTVMLNEGVEYEGDISRIRIDFEGSSLGEKISIKDFKLAKAVAEGPSTLYLDRTFHTYSDKLHQELHFMTTAKLTGIKEMGIVTKIEENTVDKIIVKDSAKELHTSIDGVDWTTAEYIGFDIKNVGVFGYILPNHADAGKMTVELVEGNYVITQTFCPENGTIEPINAKETFTDNDFFTGHRIYTDENHTFDAFLKEADWERNPLKAISGDGYISYEAFKGSYRFNISSTGFNAPFFYEQNYHHQTSAKIRSDVDRPIYIRTIGKSGCLESAAVLGQNDLLLPIPTEVSKNFGGENEEPIFNAGDKEYSETLFPLMLPANVRMEFTVLNLYQNWGKFPLKQLSSIQYFWPYYHLSVGTTETSCISPWYGARDLWTLPDFRSQSMPYWFELEQDKGYSNQPQHTHAGLQYFLQYTDADGIYNATENISNVIDSSGPVYVDVDMTYISDDGKIKVSYTHVEMPQEDELRAYYEIKYEILDEVTIKDFANDFSFYSFEGYSGYYRNIGYWAENGDEDGTVYKETNGTKDPEMLVLGNDCPYVALYNLKAGGSWEFNNANMGFVIHSSNIVIGGEKINDNFVVMGKEYVYSLSMDLGEVTLKPGDTININMVISPWGHYDSTTDTSMQNIRENTCLDPLSVSVANGEKIESVFVPKILSTDGKTAEFTLSGSTDNIVVRAYGFDKLTAPKIYELVEGEWVEDENGEMTWKAFDKPTWVEYVVSSSETPDKMNNRHYYDGYTVYYDGNAKFSYAFAVDMTDAESRTFRIDASEDFTNWPPINDNGFESPLNVYVPATTLFPLTNGAIKGIGSTSLSDDANFVRYYGDGLGTGEAYFEVFKNTSDIATGKYAVVKYRIPKSNKESNPFQFYTTTDPSIDMPSCLVGAGQAYKNGEWHVMVVDLVARGAKHYAPAEGGEEYYAQYLRFDIFNVPMSADSYIDIAYIGITDDVSKVLELEKEQEEPCKEVRVFGKDNEFVIYDLDGNEIEGEEIIEGGYIAQNNNRGYRESKTSYVSGIDFINGIGDKDPSDPAFNAYRSHEVIGVKEIEFDGPTFGNAYLALAGWTCVYGGVEKYVWSADGGKTWYDAAIYPADKKIAAATGGIKNAGDGHFTSQVPGFDKDTYDQVNYENSVYQGGANSPAGIAAHLTDYVGKTVDVTFAVVPKNDTGNIRLIAHITNVRVYASDADAEAGEVCDHTRAASNYTFIDDGDSTTDKAIIVRTCKCGEKVIESSDPSFVFFFNSIGTQSNVQPLVMETSKGFRTLDASTLVVNNADKAFTTDASGVLTLSGWMGVNGGTKKVVFKVYDSNGTELTSGWTDTAATISDRTDLGGEMSKRGIEVIYGKGYDISIDLSTYFADNQKITVEFALEAAGAPEGSNDKYVYMGKFTNVSKAS